MSSETDQQSKYAWSLINRATPPKRPAAERVGDFKEIYSEFDEATAREQAARCIQCPEALCMTGCPLANRIPEWMALTAQGRFLEAAELSRATSNLPEICSRVCPQEKLCEGACILNGRADPIAIGAIERFINEFAFAHGGLDATPAPPNGRKVAIIGSGPGGLACADELARLGYGVTIFEAQAVPGGLLVNGIPAFKLEKHIVERRIDLLVRRGVEFRLNVRVGWDVSLAGLREKYDAVFLGIGAQKPKPLDVPGAELSGIVDALPLLIQKNVASPLMAGVPIGVRGRRVAVLGGGDTAMDCLRTALRDGAQEAVCLYRRDLANMPGSRKEYANALEEGAQFRFLTNPVALLGDAAGRVTAVRCVRMELGAPDASGRRSPRAVPGSEFDLPADLVVVAYGFDPVPFPPGSDLAQTATDKWGGFKTDENLMTSLPGVFAGGDSVRGPSLVVHAVRDARRAAQGIHRYLAGKPA
ncbi:Glutamate synthase [NADPH] small chain [Lacunisphaera limnophila]|uniref:Glutamate synthase [NADPH] small chain n=1 Tax=Lacunisphaera limnophila TaxID=1838286 RepID=A0A1I7PHD0_9BACT|nr:NAD(P)-dependent oxidoreductase [Lacunisphaera limnophila]AOS43007.1 Glutamate synthase [NADPH] small chain [Lacunisphaera limnophila]